MVEDAVGLDRRAVFQNQADRLGQPFRFQHDQIGQRRVVAEVDDVSQSVQQASQDLVRILGHLVLSTLLL